MSHALNKYNEAYTAAEADSEPTDELRDDLLLGFAQERPRTRAECPDTRPCPWVACRYHLYLDVHPVTGRIKYTFPGLEPWELPETCALDVADRAAARGECTTLQETGDYLNVCRERIRQIEETALMKLRTAREELE